MQPRPAGAGGQGGDGVRAEAAGCADTCTLCVERHVSRVPCAGGAGGGPAVPPGGGVGAGGSVRDGGEDGDQVRGHVAQLLH